MKPKFLSLLLILIGLTVAACSPLANKQVKSDQPAPSGGEQPGQSSAVVGPAWDQTTQVDEQGSIVVEATPLNLNIQNNALEFEVVLDTHSVDLSMDLAPLATLSTDSGLVVNATTWDAPRGGHHVTGKLLFPSTINGNPILAEANSITVQIRDVDVSLREFVWRVQ